MKELPEPPPAGRVLKTNPVYAAKYTIFDDLDYKPTPEQMEKAKVWYTKIFGPQYPPMDNGELSWHTRAS